MKCSSQHFSAHLIGLVLAFTVCTTPALAQSPNENAGGASTIIVMDGSGSMWGQIDGKTKLEIARETVSSVLATLPADQVLGLMAYGHRSKGSCDDIELIVPPAKGSAQAVQKAVNEMKFLGMTPLSAAVRKAAEALRYTEQAATVVLITDGLETCNADPCALGKELEAAGLKFTAHVIGFGLAKEQGAQLACLAESTGGKYLQASDAASLNTALTAAIAEAPAPLPKAELIAPDTAAAGTSLSVQWSGPSTDQDVIGVQNAEGVVKAETYVTAGKAATMRLPPTAGAYQIVYRQADSSRRTLATRPITITASDFSLSAPDSVAPGAEIAITHRAPVGAQDTIVIAKAGDDSYISYSYVGNGGIVTLTAPEELGSYELRYRFGDQIYVSTRAITVR